VTGEFLHTPTHPPLHRGGSMALISSSMANSGTAGTSSSILFCDIRWVGGFSLQEYPGRVGKVKLTISIQLQATMLVSRR
jgi:hypothetical protein